MIYMDQAATSWPKPARVVEAVNYMLTGVSANAGRGNFATSEQASNLINGTREKIASFFGMPSRRGVIFTSSATEAANAVLLGTLKEGDHVITSTLEHNAIARTLYALEQKGISTTKIYRNPVSGVRLERVEEAIRPNTKLIVWNHASNVFGTLSDLDGLSRLAQAYKIKVMVDGAQTAGSIPIHMDDMGIDYLTCSGHKGLYGPQGIGLLLLRNPDEALPVWKYGETGDKSELLPLPMQAPECYEAGTPNLPGIAGLAEGIEFVLEQTLEKIHTRNLEKIETIYENLSEIEGVILYGPPPGIDKVHILSFNIIGMLPDQVGEELFNRWEISVRTGLQSSYWAHEAAGTLPYGTVRVSVGCYTGGQDLEELAEAVETLTLEVKSRS